MDKLHRSRVDSGWMMLVLVMAVFSLLVCAMLALRGYGVLALPLFVLTAVLPMWTVVSTRYHVLGDYLRVNAGPFRWRIDLKQITKVEPCHNWYPAPAMSVQRLRITCVNESKKSFTLEISPEDRYQFIIDLGVAEPDLE